MASQTRQDFPEGELDESRQPLDRSLTNSWTLAPELTAHKQSNYFSKDATKAFSSSL